MQCIMGMHRRFKRALWLSIYAICCINFMRTTYNSCFSAFREFRMSVKRFDSGAESNTRPVTAQSHSTPSTSHDYKLHLSAASPAPGPCASRRVFEPSSKRETSRHHKMADPSDWRTAFCDCCAEPGGWDGCESLARFVAHSALQQLPDGCYRHAHLREHGVCCNLFHITRKVLAIYAKRLARPPASLLMWAPSDRHCC